MSETLKSENRRAESETLFVKLASALGSQLGLLVFGTLTQIVLARFLGPDGKGMFSLTAVTAITLSTLTHFSLSGANSHFAGRYPEHRRAMVGNSILFAFLWGGLVTVGILVLKRIVPAQYLPDIDRRLWGMVLVAIIPLLLFELSNGLVMGLDWIKRFSLVQPLRDLILLAGLSFFVLNGSLSVETAVAVWVIAIVMVAILQIASAWWRVGANITVDHRLLFRMTGYSIQIHVANVFAFLRLRADWFLIDHFTSHRELGIYTVAGMFITALWYLPTAISQVLIPYISTRDNQAGDHLTPLLSRLVTVASLAGAFFLAISGYWLILFLVGRDYLPAYPALLLLLPGGVAMSFARVFAGDFLGRGLPKYNLIIAVISPVVNIAINLVLIPKFGILGAAATASITYVLLGLLYLYFFHRVTGIAPGEMLLLRRTDVSLLLKSLRRR